MFYSRPNIQPLGWDLVELPVPNGSRNFDGRTSDDRPIDFRFSSGWLSVEIGAPGASCDDDLQLVLESQISPFGTLEIWPEQICDILGLTVKGKVVDAAGLNPPSRGFDWSGRTTYWRSTHRLLIPDDSDLLQRELATAFPDASLVQLSWPGGPLHMRCSRVDALLPAEGVTALVFDIDSKRLDAIAGSTDLAGDEMSRMLQPRIQLVRRDFRFEDPTGRNLIAGESARDLKYEVHPHHRYEFQMEFESDSKRANSIAEALISVISKCFRRDLEIVNLATGLRISSDNADAEDQNSYGNRFGEWCLAGPNRYLWLSIAIDSATGSPILPRTPVGFRPQGQREP